MKKNFKKYLSYVLGVVLAMGLGLSYAYAVGANDSNAFVTTTEWEQRVAQIEASIDNVNKTINDMNMDFMLNGPRLQLSLIEGFENSAGTNYQGIPLNMPTKVSTWSSYQNQGLRASDLSILDMWNGKQAVVNYDWYGGDTNGDEFNCKCRFAMQTNEDPNIYLIYSIYYLSSNRNVAHAQCGWVDISKAPQVYTSAKTLSVTVSNDDWCMFEGTDFTERSRTSSNIYTGDSGFMQPNRVVYSGNNSPTYGAMSNPATGYASVTLSGNTATFKYEFPANAPVMRVVNGGTGERWSLFPYKLKGRKLGNSNDMIYIGTSAPSVSIAKVYSPQKGCLALKTFINGEIPIFNE